MVNLLASLGDAFTSGMTASLPLAKVVTSSDLRVGPSMPPPSLHDITITYYINFKLDPAVNNHSKYRQVMHPVLSRYSIRNDIQVDTDRER